MKEHNQICASKCEGAQQDMRSKKSARAPIKTARGRGKAGRPLGAAGEAAAPCESQFAPG
jgi:hypothetical protein